MGWQKVDLETGEVVEAPEINRAFGNLAAVTQVCEALYYAETAQEKKQIVRSTPIELIEIIFKYSLDKNVKEAFLKYSTFSTKLKIKKLIK